MKSATQMVRGLLVLLVTTAYADCGIDANTAKDLGWQKIGQLKTATAADLPASDNAWSIGAETMDRNYTVFDKWSKYLPALGAKRARLQAGWARTEKTKGTYSWEWMDEIVHGMVNVGVMPWIELSYGNPIYPGGGNNSTKSPLPSGEGLTAFLDWSTAVVKRYGALGVKEWEIWNEPLHAGAGAQAYSDFALTVAKTVRATQSDSIIIAGVSAGVNTGLAESLAQTFKKAGALDLFNQFTFHPYSYNPDTSYDSIQDLREKLHAISPDTSIFQGENGAPSRGGRYGALSGYNWTECSQAKWATRRLVGDAARDIPSNLFSMVDMCYNSEQNYKGVLAVDCPDPTVTHAKIAYYAAQRVFNAIPSTFTANEHALVTLSLTDPLPAPSKDPSGDGPVTQQFSFQGPKGHTMLAFWGSHHTPVNEDQTGTVHGQLATNSTAIQEPALLDPLTGAVYELKEGEALAGVSDGQAFRVPVTDSVLIVTEKSLLPMQ